MSTSNRLAESLQHIAAAQRAAADALDVLAKTITTGDGTDAQLLDVREAAKHLNMSVSWVYRSVEDGTLPHLRIGSRVRFKRGELDTYIASR